MESLRVTLQEEWYEKWKKQGTVVGYSMQLKKAEDSAEILLRKHVFSGKTKRKPCVESSSKQVDVSSLTHLFQNYISMETFPGDDRTIILHVTTPIKHAGFDSFFLLIDVQSATISNCINLKFECCHPHYDCFGRILWICWPKCSALLRYQWPEVSGAKKKDVSFCGIQKPCKVKTALYIVAIQDEITKFVHLFQRKSVRSLDPIGMVEIPLSNFAFDSDMCFMGVSDVGNDCQKIVLYMRSFGMEYNVHSAKLKKKSTPPSALMIADQTSAEPEQGYLLLKSMDIKELLFTPFSKFQRDFHWVESRKLQKMKAALAGTPLTSSKSSLKSTENQQSSAINFTVEEDEIAPAAAAAAPAPSENGEASASKKKDEFAPAAAAAAAAPSENGEAPASKKISQREDSASELPKIIVHAAEDNPPPPSYKKAVKDLNKPVAEKTDNDVKENGQEPATKNRETLCFCQISCSEENFWNNKTEAEVLEWFHSVLKLLKRSEEDLLVYVQAVPESPQLRFVLRPLDGNCDATSDSVRVNLEKMQNEFLDKEQGTSFKVRQLILGTAIVKTKVSPLVKLNNNTLIAHEFKKDVKDQIENLFSNPTQWSKMFMVNLASEAVDEKQTEESDVIVKSNDDDEDLL